MNIPVPTRIWLCVFFGLGAASPAWAAHQTEVVVVSNLTDDGEAVAHPDRAHPVFYLPIMSGFMEPTLPVVRGEHPPPADAVAHQVALALSRQGYFLARPGLRVNANLEIAYADGTVVKVPPSPRLDGRLALNGLENEPLTVAMIESPDGPYSFHSAHRAGPHRTLSPLIQVFRTVDPVHGPVIQAMPSLVLVIQWGDLHSGMTSGTPDTFDLPIWISILGGDHFGGNSLADISPRDISALDRDDIVQRMDSDRFFVVVAAYDFKSCLSGHKKTLLWRTRMSVPSNLPGARFADLLPVMLKAGESRLGRETNHPELSVEPLTPEGTVSVGPLVVKDYQEVPQTTPDTGPDRFLPLKFAPDP